MEVAYPGSLSKVRESERERERGLGFLKKKPCRRESRREKERETERQEEKEREREAGRVAALEGGGLPPNGQIAQFQKNILSVSGFYSGETRLKILSVSGFIPEKPELELAVSVSVRFKSPGI